MFTLLLAVGFTLGVSFFCSLMEAMILSTSVIEVETLKKNQPRRGQLLEALRANLGETISTILTLNTIANTLGSIMVGGIATRLYGNAILGLLSAGMTIGILVFSEVIPKNLGVTYRVQLQPLLAYPLTVMAAVLRPITYLCNLLVRAFIKTPDEIRDSGDEILFLAERGARTGDLSKSESSIIANALSLEDVRVSEIMTPRTVVSALRRSATIGDIFKEYNNIPFARIPVYGKTLDDIVGLIRRRDLLKAKANDLDTDTVEKHMQEIHFIPETVTVADALQVFLKTHQQLLVTVDEFGSTAGVVTMEDVMEQILGREIFEKDDIAVDMRELARTRLLKQTVRPRKAAPQTQPPFPPKAGGGQS
ncbi:MAG: hemolysin family protein [Verrucomicrobiota bacterium]